MPRSSLWAATAVLDREVNPLIERLRGRVREVDCAVPATQDLPVAGAFDALGAIIGGGISPQQVEPPVRIADRREIALMRRKLETERLQGGAALALCRVPARAEREERVERDVLEIDLLWLDRSRELFHFRC